jgi:hypothetical protein
MIDPPIRYAMRQERVETWTVNYINYAHGLLLGGSVLIGMQLEFAEILRDRFNEEYRG